jgi:hypothetical protein
VTAPPLVDAQSIDDRLFCYRHPERETWVRCGRCDRPICTRCAMQGPVGSRCKQCGTLAFDPLTSFTPIQLVGGIAVAVGAGVIAGYLSGRIGFFSVIVAWFAGGIIAELVTRVTGYKRGPVMLAIVCGGILAGSLLGGMLAFLVDYGTLIGYVGDDADVIPIQSIVLDAATWALVAAAAASVGAWQKLR